MPETFDFSKILNITDASWVQQYLVEHPSKNSPKITIRAYTLSFSGTKQEFEGLAQFVSQNIDKFVFSQAEINQFKKEGKQPFQEAMHFFGDKQPDTDGKYGELILFLLTESILKTPMVAHKLSALQNPSDQVKGGDGIFLGEYDSKSAILIGESKIQQKVGDAIAGSFQSIDRFHAPTGALAHELHIARRTFAKDLTQADLDYIYSSLNPSSPEYKARIMVHPILIMYDNSQIGKIEKGCADREDGEAKMRQHMVKEVDELQKKVSSELKKHKAVQAVYLDAFFIPLSDVKMFRELLYHKIHGALYKKAISKGKK
jgi:hypothetical protein